MNYVCVLADLPTKNIYGMFRSILYSITFALLEDPTALVILCMQTIQVGKFFIYAHKQTAHITIPQYALIQKSDYWNGVSAYTPINDAL